jgi:hypothetical protein
MAPGPDTGQRPDRSGDAQLDCDSIERGLERLCVDMHGTRVLDPRDGASVRFLADAKSAVNRLAAPVLRNARS